MKIDIFLFYFMYIFGLATVVYSWFRDIDITIPLLSVIMVMIGIIGGKVLEK